MILSALRLLANERRPDPVACVLDCVFALAARERGMRAPMPDVPDEVVSLLSQGPKDLGTAYEAMIGTTIVTALRPSVVIPVKKAGSVVTDTLIALDALESVPANAERVEAGASVVLRSVDRRRSGSHFTPPAIAARVVDRVLAPLEKRDVVGDIAMGSAAFLLAARDWLIDHGRTKEEATNALHGVDKDPIAVTLARRSLWLAHGDDSLPLDFADSRLRLGDALRREMEWPRRFDALLGNPPWVSYAGRAAQPLDDETFDDYASRFQAFRGYRNLQGLFIEQCAMLLEPGGRLGLIVPSSMSEQEGYAPTREAHDALCVCDEELIDFGEHSFEGVFQPCMLLSSTRRAEPVRGAAHRWPVARDDLDAIARSILLKMDRERMPPEVFGERGLQSQGVDLDHLDHEGGAPMRSGSDIDAFTRKPPSHRADPTHFGKRLRTPEDWRKVAVFVRQTARYPIAALSDGCAFRNSILACFAAQDLSAETLVAYLNATPVRYAHYMQNRDARQGMPQVKVGHLRALPAPPPSIRPALARLGAALSHANQPPSEASQDELDAIVAGAFDLTLEERARLVEFRRTIR